MMKWLGAILVLSGCCAVGLLVISSQKSEERALEQLIRLLEYMLCELPYRMTPLPELCRNASSAYKGCVGNVLIALAEEMEAQLTPEASLCMHSALTKVNGIPERTAKCLSLVGSSLGRFDLAGQVRGLEGALKQTVFELETLQRNKAVRYRSYQTLSLCAGAALVLLFL